MGSNGPRGVCRPVLAALLGCTFGGAVLAQEAQPPGKSEPPAPASGPAPAAPSAAAATHQLAELTVAAAVRCFASDLSPCYEDKLPAGTVVEIGEEVGAFRRVRLPLGVVGYVSKKFTGEPEDGMLVTLHDRVSFRYVPTPPNRAMAPVKLLDKGTKLRFLGETGTWWRVLYPAESAFLPIKELKPTSGEKAEAAWQQFVKSQEAGWQAMAKARAASVAEQKVAAERVRRFGSLRDRLAAEVGKPMDQQKLDPLLTEADQLIGELGGTKGEAKPAEASSGGKSAPVAKPDPLLVDAQRLREAIHRQQLLVQAKALVVKDVPVDTKVPTVKAEPKDGLGHLEAIGWLRYRPRSGAQAYQLMKGGEVVAYLSCRSMCYDLAKFDGFEIGVTGTRERGITESSQAISAVEVRRIEVLTPRR
ncbi:MAG: hypothetical protein KDC87_05935 [Planctomycetes bacterium]|nr:hypothetical protein [Planctomycetota bacterium]MCB9869506.1 hypothetical protein [Planctomycetota bacterium]